MRITKISLGFGTGLIFNILITYSTFATGSPGYDLTGATCPVKREQGYGPFDYTNASHRADKLPIVEKHHFTKEVETLRKGTTAKLPGDISYTLNAFPNHHRALYAMMRFQLKENRPANAKYPPVECYLQRAMDFKPDDFRVMQLYANYLVKKKHPKMAIDVYNRALSIKDVPLDINYSLGLLYLDLKEYDKAVEQAKIAYAGGIKKSKLKSKLKKINRWPPN